MSEGAQPCLTRVLKGAPWTKQTSSIPTVSTGAGADLAESTCSGELLVQSPGPQRTEQFQRSE